MIDLNELAREMYRVAEKRRSNGAFEGKENNPVNLLKHCATEIVEASLAADSYVALKNMADMSKTDLEERWPGIEEPDAAEESFQEYKSQFISELSDIVACVLIIMGEEGFDVEKALTECLEKNTARANKKGDKK